MAQSLHSKLQAEKSRLAVAVQACEAATASISRPSSPLETAMQPIPEKELMVRAKLEDLIDQVRANCCDVRVIVAHFALFFYFFILFFFMFDVVCAIFVFVFSLCII